MTPKLRHSAPRCPLFKVADVISRAILVILNIHATSKSLVVGQISDLRISGKKNYAGKLAPPKFLVSFVSHAPPVVSVGNGAKVSTLFSVLRRIYRPPLYSAFDTGTHPRL